MKVSIITVCYNSIQTLRQTIESVLSQNYPDIEYIIIDGDSTDGTVELIQNYGKRIAQFVSEKDQGIYDALNKGISRATGEVVGILHADDFYEHREVITQVAQALSNQPSDSLYGDLVYVNAKNPDQVIRFWRSGEYRQGVFRWGWMPPHPTFFVKKSVYDRYGAFNLRLKSAADYELMLRLLHCKQISTQYLPQVLVRMRVGGMSNRSLKNRLHSNREDQLAWKYNNLKAPLFLRWLKPFRKLSQYLLRPSDD